MSANDRGAGSDDAAVRRTATDEASGCRHPADTGAVHTRDEAADEQPGRPERTQQRAGGVGLRHQIARPRERVTHEEHRGADPRVGVVAVQGRQATLDKTGSQVVARQLRRTPLRPQFDGLVHGRGIAE